MRTAKRSLAPYFWCGVPFAIVIASACQESKTGEDADRAAGSAGDSADAGGNLGFGGRGDTPSGVSGAPAASDGGTGTGEGAGATAGRDGGSGGVLDTGGASGTTAFEELPLLGPTTVNQAPVLVAAESLPGNIGLNIQQIQACDGGGFLVYDGQRLSRFTTTFELDWQASVWGDLIPASFSSTIESFSLTEGCGALFGGKTSIGLPQHEPVGGYDAFVFKVDDHGAVAWIHQWGSSADESVRSLIERDDGSVLAVGSCTGQVPGSPASSLGLPFTLLVDADGETISLEQYQPFAEASGELDLSKLSSGGELVYQLQGNPPLFQTRDWEAGLPLRSTPIVGVRLDDDAECGEVAVHAWTAFGAHGFHQKSGSFYGFNGPPSQPPASPPCGIRYTDSGGLAKFDLSGAISWIRSPVVEEEIIDTDEGTIWTGRMSELADLLVTDDATYVFGRYHNAYKFGSVVPPATFPIFVGRYDLDGERIWFTEFLIDLPTPLLKVAPAFILQDEYLVALVAINAAWYVVRIDPATGEVQ